MSEGKLLVLGTILKLDKPFRPPHIGDMTGLDRQLIAYHLRTFTEKGYLEKIGKSYVIRDKEGLLSSLMESAEKTETAKMKPRGFFNSEGVKQLNIKAETTVAARTLNLPMSQEAKEGMLKKIDDSIAELRNLRKYLTNATKTHGSAVKFFKNEIETDAAWQILLQNGGYGFDLAEFSSALEIAMVEGDSD